MPLEFRVVPHRIKLGMEVVEIVSDGHTIGAIYPGEREKEIKIVSAHFETVAKDEDFAGEVIEDDGSVSYPPIPSVIVSFNPSPYSIIDGKIMRVSAH